MNGEATPAEECNEEKGVTSQPIELQAVGWEEKIPACTVANRHGAAVEGSRSLVELEGENVNSDPSSLIFFAAHLDAQLPSLFARQVPYRSLRR